MKSLLTSFYFIPLAFLAALNFPASAQTNTFAYTGTIQTYTVPAGTTTIGIGVAGGSGGGAIGAVAPAAIGGYGAVMYGVFTVTPGQVLKVLVGGAGQTVTYSGGGGGQGRCSGAGAGGGGGYSGGGAGGELTSGNGIYQSGGGGGSYNPGSDAENSIATDTGNGAAAIRICPSTINSTAGESICIGGTITLSSNATDGVWSGYGGVNVTPAGVVTGEAAGTAVISYKVNSCPTISITVTINPSPRTGTIAGADNTCIGLTATLIESVTGGTWTSSSTAVANISAAGVVTGVSAGSVDVTYTVADATTGCSNFVLFPFMVTGPCPSGVNAVANRGAGLLVYPNPNPGKFQVLISTVQNEQATVTITNIVGEKIKVFSATTNKETPTELNMPAGMYFINATTKDNRWTAKVMIND